MNWIALVELAPVVMVTQMDIFNRLLDTGSVLSASSS
jgi:hypothetical protein